jgi:hypothetical protein
MGRELKRVPLDFDWPQDKIWDGYINPHYQKCPACENGQLPARDQLDRLCSLIAWLGFTTMPGYGRERWHPMFDSTHIPRPIDPKLFEVIDGLCRAGDAISRERYPSDRPLQGLTGLGAGDDYHIILLLLRNAGLPHDWGMCPVCHGDAIDPAHAKAYEEWERIDPPEGEGYQVWETVSEGSPISPVFASADDLTEWLVGKGYSRHAAKAFIEQGWVMSMIMVNTGGQVKMYQDIESAGALKAPGELGKE